MPGEPTHYLYSEDCIVDDDPNNPLMEPEAAAAAQAHKARITPEMVHAETPSGMPHHELRLKVGAVAMIIRNLDITSGLVNGLRVEIVCVSRLVVRVKAISGGPNIKDREFDLSRIDFEGDMEATVRIRRTQFPLKLAFAMTINKSQGMTLEKVRMGSFM
jgi:ATP-dependent DNA helicase PIF1